jgi:hypothetical protein
VFREPRPIFESRRQSSGDSDATSGDGDAKSVDHDARFGDCDARFGDHDARSDDSDARSGDRDERFGECDARLAERDELIAFSARGPHGATNVPATPIRRTTKPMSFPATPTTTSLVSPSRCP